MVEVTIIGTGTADDPWVLKTPPGSSEYKLYRDESSNPPALVCIVGTTKLSYQLRCLEDLHAMLKQHGVSYQLRCLEDLHAMLKQHGDWMPLGSADEQKPAAEGTVEAWARSPQNPVGGWYGLKKGLRGRFANYVPPLMEVLGFAELEHNARNNRMRAR